MQLASRDTCLRVIDRCRLSFVGFLFRSSWRYAVSARLYFGAVLLLKADGLPSPGLRSVRVQSVAAPSLASYPPACSIGATSDSFQLVTMGPLHRHI